MKNPKITVLNRFLDFVAMYIPLAEARVATLGGYGLEAQLWAERGIPSPHGWLIERHRKRGRDLIAAHRYNVHNQLSTFRQMLAGHGGADDCIDGFHLDLCGTLTPPALAGFADALELTLRSEGRSLAITVADARRNKILEDWVKLRERSDWLFGTKATEFLKVINRQQHCLPVRIVKGAPAFFKPFNQDKAAQREFALLVQVAELFMGYRATCARMERYVYVSRYSGKSFRMRTYFFHLEKSRAYLRPLELAALWLDSPLFWVTSEGLSAITRESELKQTTPVATATTVQKGQEMHRTKAKPESTPTTSPSELEQMARLAGGKIETQYDLLVDAQKRLQAIMNLAQASNIPAPKNGPSPAFRMTTRLPEGEQFVSLGDTVRESLGGTHETRKILDWEGLSRKDRILWTLKAAEERSTYGKEWPQEKWEARITADFGTYTPKLGRSLRSAMAHLSGNRKKFLEDRIRENFTPSEAEQQLKRLNAL